MGEKDFGGKFPTHGKSSEAGNESKFKTGPFPKSGKPEAKKNSGGKFPDTERKGNEPPEGTTSDRRS